MFYILLRRTLMLWTCTLFACLAQAQNISVVGELSEDPIDQTANTSGTMKTDLNDNAALSLKYKLPKRD